MQEIEQLYQTRSAYIIMIVLLMSGFTGIRYAYTNIFRNTYHPLALFSFKPMAEQGAGIKLLSTENLLITLLLAASISFSILVFGEYYFSDQAFLDYRLPSTLGNVMLTWVLLILAIALIYLIKFTFVAVIGWLFDFPLTQSAHYQEYQSMSHVFNFFYALVLGLAVIGMTKVNTSFLGFMAYLYLYLFIFRQIVLIFRLYVKGGYSIFYIFSYICTTELIPWIICIGILLNR